MGEYHLSFVCFGDSCVLRYKVRVVRLTLLKSLVVLPSQNCTAVTTVTFEGISPPQKEAPYPSNTAPPPHPDCPAQPLGLTDQLCFSGFTCSGRSFFP